MGRRALPKFDPLLDLEKRLFVVEQLEGPFEPADYFPQDQPLVVEVGSGKGLFLRRAAELRPESNFVGIEIAKRYAAYCAAQLERRELSNAIMFQGDGVRFVSEHLRPDSVAEVHVYFPDPWWKARHRKRRVMNETLILGIQRCLKPGGWLHFWTDVEEYFQTTLSLIADVSQLEGPFPVPERDPEDDMDYRTHFERRKRQDGLPIYRSQYQKRG